MSGTNSEGQGSQSEMVEVHQIITSKEKINRLAFLARHERAGDSDRPPALGDRHQPSPHSPPEPSTPRPTLPAASAASSLFAVAVVASEKKGWGSVAQQLSLNIRELEELLALHFIPTATVKNGTLIQVTHSDK